MTDIKTLCALVGAFSLGVMSIGSVLVWWSGWERVPYTAALVAASAVAFAVSFVVWRLA